VYAVKIAAKGCGFHGIRTQIIKGFLQFVQIYRAADADFADAVNGNHYAAQLV
jgi:hypothetical protein